MVLTDDEMWDLEESAQQDSLERAVEFDHDSEQYDNEDYWRKFTIAEIKANHEFAAKSM